MPKHDPESHRGLIEKLPRSQGSETEDGRTRRRRAAWRSRGNLFAAGPESRVEKTAAESNSRTMPPDLVDMVSSLDAH